MVRQNAAVALGLMEAGQAHTDALSRALADPDDQVRRNVATALDRIRATAKSPRELALLKGHATTRGTDGSEWAGVRVQ